MFFLYFEGDVFLFFQVFQGMISVFNDTFSRCF